MDESVHVYDPASFDYKYYTVINIYTDDIDFSKISCRFVKLLKLKNHVVPRGLFCIELIDCTNIIIESDIYKLEAVNSSFTFNSHSGTIVVKNYKNCTIDTKATCVDLLVIDCENLVYNVVNNNVRIHNSYNCTGFNINDTTIRFCKYVDLRLFDNGDSITVEECGKVFVSKQSIGSNNGSIYIKKLNLFRCNSKLKFVKGDELEIFGPEQDKIDLANLVGFKTIDITIWDKVYTTKKVKFEKVNISSYIFTRLNFNVYANEINVRSRHDNSCFNGNFARTTRNKFMFKIRSILKSTDEYQL